MSDGAGQAGGVQQGQSQGTTFDAGGQDRAEAEQLLREAFERMLLLETYQMMNEAISK